MLNFNIGLLGHVDSGKTTLAKALSAVASTAAFDKNKQSQERGITLDLGFSSTVIEAPQQISYLSPEMKQIQLTFVDCPGHASLIRTIIGGAQIVDLMILVIDGQRGIQTQTAECIVIGELLKRKLIIVVNKIDVLNNNGDAYLKKLHEKLRKTFAKTYFGHDVPIYDISAQCGTNIQTLLDGIQAEIYLPERNTELPLLIYVDHCFSIKGHGTVCTGTIIQGEISIGDTIDIPQISEQRKVKTIQVFRRPVEKAVMGDRVGICVTQFNAKLLERGVVTRPGYLKPIFAVCICLERIAYYKFSIKHKSKYHITVGHETVMGTITLFRNNEDEAGRIFDLKSEYEFVEELSADISELPVVFALIEFENAILAASNATLIASKLDMDIHSNSCRLAFWRQIQWLTYSNQYASCILPDFKIFRRKTKEGIIQRIINNNEIIVQDLFKKETDPNVFVGKHVELSTGEEGFIENKFGMASKIKVRIKTGLKEETLERLKICKLSDITIKLNYKKDLRTLGRSNTEGYVPEVFVQISIPRSQPIQKIQFHYNTFLVSKLRKLLAVQRVNRLNGDSSLQVVPVYVIWLA